MWLNSSYGLAKRKCSIIVFSASVELVVAIFFLKIAVEIKLEFSGLMDKDFVSLQNGCR